MVNPSYFLDLKKWNIFQHRESHVKSCHRGNELFWRGMITMKKESQHACIFKTPASVIIALDIVIEVSLTRILSIIDT